MSNLTSREIERFRFPLPVNLRPLHPEKFYLEFAKGFAIDFGALCYLTRGGGAGQYKIGRVVDISSLSQKRTIQISRLIETVIAFCTEGSRSIRSNYADFHNLVFFLDWSDCNNQGAFESKESTELALQNYIYYLKRQVDQSLLKQQTAKRYSMLYEIFEHFYNDDSFGRSIKRFSVENVITTPTTVPDIEDQEKVLAWAKCLFRGLTDLVVNQKPFPYALTVPSYVDWPNNKMWIFPIHAVWCCPPTRPKPGKNYWAYDFDNGLIRTEKEISYLADNDIKDALQLFRLAKKYLKKSNDHFYCKNRLLKGLLAVQSFLVLFYANTGMNSSQVIEMPWSEELEGAVKNPTTQRLGFRTIKYRANNKIQSFEVGTEFIPLFRQFLNLRKYILNGQTFDYLFFSFGAATSSSLKPVKLADKNYKSFYQSVRAFLPQFPKITARQWRAAKQDYLIRNHDPVTAATVMQHSVDTALKKYSNGSAINQRTELVGFFNQLNSVVLSKGEEIKGSQPTAVGICSVPNSPNSTHAESEIVPDCKTPEGCLFCGNFRVHADEIDIRKLLSGRYVLRKIQPFAESDGQLNNYFELVLNKCDSILSLLESNNCELFKRIEIEVEDGDLDAFWNAKLQMLIELDVL